MASADKETVSSTLHALGGVARSRRTRRIGIGLLIFIVLFGLLGFFAAPPLIRHIAEQQLSKQLDRPATIQRIALNPYTLNLEADGIHLGDKGGQGDFIDIAKLVVRPSWSSLFRGAPIVNEVRLDSPRFHIVRYDAQRFNFTDLIEKFSTPSPKPESKPTQFSVSNIQVNNGRIDFDDRLLNEKHVVDNWTLGIPYIATLASKTDIFVEPKLRARFDGSPIAIDGKTKPFAQSRESEIALKFDGLDVPKLISYVPAKLPVAVTSGLLSSDLKVNFVMSGETPALRVSGTVDLNDAKVTDHASAPLFAARSVHVAAASLEPLRNAMHFDEIRIDQPVVDLSRDKQGVLNVEKLAAQPAAASKAAEGKPAASGVAAASAAAVAAASGAKAEAGAKEAPPLDLTIRHFAIDGGTVNVDDRVPATPTALSLTKLAATLDGFSMQGKTPAKYTLSTSLSRGGDVTAEGTFNLAEKQAESKLTVAALALPALQPYLGEATRARVLDGTLGATVNAKADWGKTPLAAQVADSTISLKSLKIATPDAKAPAIVLPDASAKIAKVDVAARTAEIASVDASGLALDVQRLKDGKIDLAALAEPAQASVPKRTVARKAEAAAPSWHYRIDALNVKDSSANFTDLSTPRPVKLAIKPLDLSVQKISDDMTKPLPVQLKATLNRKGSLNVTGDVTAQPLKLGLKINGNRLDAAAFEPYFGSALNATIASALLNAQGNLTFAQVKDTPRATYRGDVALVDVRMLDKATSDPFAGWRSLALTNLKANYDEKGTDVDASRVTFSNFYGRVLLDAQGRLNLKDVVAKESGPAQSLTRDASKSEPVPLSPGMTPPAAAQGASAAAAQQASAPAAASATVVVKAATPPQSPVRMHFGELLLQNGRVTYTDNFIKPNYTANLVAIKGTVGAFGTDSTTSAPVDVAANLAGNGPISIKGSVNPLIEKPALDLTATAHDIELTNLTPYSAKYAGYPITKGKLNVDLHYALENDQLKANNHIFIDQLTFGDHVENDTATKLPVKLAISLLKNTRGQIDVNLPVSGSLSNPEFSVGGLIWRAVLNLIAKAVTSPFSLLAHAFGSGGEDLGYVEFAPGSYQLDDAQQKKLDTVVKMLTEKPSIRLDLIGRVDPAKDTSGLGDAYVERLVRQQKLKDVVGQGESIDPMSVKVEPAEYSKYLTRAYKAADFKKPRNLIGLQKTLPDADMKKALAEHAPADDNALRALAQQRAQAVRQYLDGKIDSSRVFVVAPKLDAKGIEDKGATTRVDFGLQ
ncbi:AsmA family protein [Burkholderia cepacia]|nr:AsmA family protein [Burkholderia cepacia]